MKSPRGEYLSISHILRGGVIIDLFPIARCSFGKPKLIINYQSQHLIINLSTTNANLLILPARYNIPHSCGGGLAHLSFGNKQLQDTLLETSCRWVTVTVVGEWQWVTVTVVSDSNSMTVIGESQCQLWANEVQWQLWQGMKTRKISVYL